MTASILAGAGMRRHVNPGNHAAESFVSFIPLFDRPPILRRELLSSNTARAYTSGGASPILRVTCVTRSREGKTAEHASLRPGIEVVETTATPGTRTQIVTYDRGREAKHAQADKQRRSPP